MRLKISFTKNDEIVNIQNQSLVNSYIHTCLGRNNGWHDAKNSYCISSLQGGKLNSDRLTLSFDNGSYIVVTSSDMGFINKLLIGVLNNTNFIGGMKFAGVDYIDEIFYDGWNHFATLSPFVIKEYLNKKTYKFITLNDENFQGRVKEHLIKKLMTINRKLDLNNFDVSIPSNASHKVKSILIKNVINKANQCQISVMCSKQVAELLYNIGIGQSTGSGFGTIYKTENRSKY